VAACRHHSAAQCRAGPDGHAESRRDLARVQGSVHSRTGDAHVAVECQRIAASPLCDRSPNNSPLRAQNCRRRRPGRSCFTRAGRSISLSRRRNSHRRSCAMRVSSRWSRATSWAWPNRNSRRAQGGLVLRLAAGRSRRAQALGGVIVLTSADGSVQALDVKAVHRRRAAGQFHERRQQRYRTRAGAAVCGGGRVDPQSDALRAADPRDESVVGRVESGRGQTRSGARRPGLRRGRRPQLRGARHGRDCVARERRGRRLGISAAGTGGGGWICAADLCRGAQSFRRIRTRRRHRSRAMH
jgi:hypothetical protein